jgi:D-tyrosyl-tRNA(Tyr) deacylase
MMRAVVQRVARASVSVKDEHGTTSTTSTTNTIVGVIGKGLVVLLGVGRGDIEKDAEYLAQKIVNLRIFEDENDKMNISLLDIKGQLLVVSQFTLYGDCRKGKRPSYERAAIPEQAVAIYERFVDCCKSYGLTVETGKFQAMMQVELVNDGPVTLLLDSSKEF